MELRAHVLAHPPRCLADVRAAATDLVEDRDMDSVAFQLSSPAGSAAAWVLGHRGSRYNLRYDGNEFISPLSLSWPDAASATPFFDSDVHGYHGEMECPAKLRGEGSPEPFVRPGRGGDLFQVRVQLDHGGACQDLVEDEPELAVEDYFMNLMVDGRCTACGRDSRILDMDL